MIAFKFIGYEILIDSRLLLLSKNNFGDDYFSVLLYATYFFESFPLINNVSLFIF